ncbi:LacI family DNA-binding transcriptional regulator [Streptomyces formicae]|uniref:DeoR/GlpR family transcriptional regulator n=1 Tax=Streptomyces formicae TaxID=1616117 RepID=A0ABY3WHS6_9ACTN|nr:substrate-binding domain-containing protein [Streptomyces formicae]UNM12139.1 DeoR/GlpR family transcriptional regulator [Streptomyces formicae]
MRYTVDERHERILELVRACGSLRVTELAERLGVSTVTARRDVETLASRGRVHRVRGAVSWPGAPAEPAAAVPQQSAVPGPASARRVSTGLLLGMVVPQTHYFAEIVRGAQETAAEVGARLVLAFSGYRRDLDVAETERMRKLGANGLLLTPSWDAPGSTLDTAELGGDVPAVLVERRGQAGTEAAELDRVCSDHESGAGLAVRHLFGLGHTAIALVTGVSPTAARLATGYRAALGSLGITEPPTELTELYAGHLDHQQLDTAADHLADAVSRGLVTAALVLSDFDAMVLLQMLRNKGVRVPEDLALVAYGDDVGALSDLPLTAVAPPKYEVGQVAVQLLLSRVRERAGGAHAGHLAASRRHVDLVPRLHVRASCGAAGNS